MSARFWLPLTLLCALMVAGGVQAQADSVCGDGLIEGAEQCDDGNVEPGDGCDSACRIECEKHCDCPQEYFCYKGVCLRDEKQAVYCCEKAGCPPGATCIDAENQKDRCPEDATFRCDSACDCGPAHCCNDNICVKDIDDPWLPGGTEMGPSCELGVDATYCSTGAECHAGYLYWGLTLDSGFRCWNPLADEARSFCGGPDCFYSGDCDPGQVCVDMRTDDPAGSTPGSLSSPLGGACVSSALAEANFAWPPFAILSPCGLSTGTGYACEAGWRPGDTSVIERVVGSGGSCGNGTCEFVLGETSANCAADCACGDGSCDTSEVGTCTADCGACSASGCAQPVQPPGWSTLSVCGDGVCQRDGRIPEGTVNCSLDCDAVPVSVTAGLEPATPDGDNGWYRSDVKIDWNIAGDPEPEVVSGCETGPFTNDGNDTKNCTVSNGVGQPVSASVSFKIDQTPPSVNVTGVTDGAQYLLGSVPAAACATTDATSGVATAAVLAAPPDHTTIGFKSVQCVGAKDHAGNSADSSVTTYSVVYDATEILQPINPEGSSTFKLNSTIPVKIKLSGASAGTSDAVITQSVSKLSDNTWGNESEGTSTATPHSGSQLRYDATNDQYIYDLATRPLGTGTFRVTLDLGGGKTETAQFSIIR
jgi:cysteine-rich repeat protein